MNKTGVPKMDKIIFALFMAICLMASASALTIESGSLLYPLQYYDGSDWQPAVAVDPIHPAWTEQVSIPGATWMWRTAKVTDEEANSGSVVDFKQTFDIPGCAEAMTGSIQITTDNAYDLYVNGVLVGSDVAWTDVETYDISSYLLPGSNDLEVRGYNNLPESQSADYTSNPAGIIYSAAIEYGQCEDGGDVPEFGAIAAGIAMIGAIGGIILFRKN
jgi:hypothetical protein